MRFLDFLADILRYFSQFFYKNSQEGGVLEVRGRGLRKGILLLEIQKIQLWFLRDETKAKNH